MLLIILNYLITFNILIHNLLIDLSIITRLSLWSSQRSPCSPDSHHPKHLLAERTPIFPLQYLDCMIMQPPPPITMIFFLFWRGGGVREKSLRSKSPQNLSRKSSTSGNWIYGPVVSKNSHRTCCEIPRLPPGRSISLAT